MLNVSVARRYARAVLEVASDSARLDPVSDQLSTLAAAMEKNRDLTEVFSDPAFTREQRHRVAEGLMKAAQVNDPAVQNLVRLLVDRARIQYLPAIARSFRTMADARQGRVRAQVSAATPLSADALSRVEQALGRLTRSRVVLESRVDPTLLGGVAAQIGSVVYDGTLRTQLEELHRNLTGRY